MQRHCGRGWNMEKVKVREEASATRADRAPRGMAGEEVVYMGPGHARLCERSSFFV